MNDSQHLSSQFDEDLTRLRTSVLQMGGLVETQISAAIDAYSRGEPTATSMTSNSPSTKTAPT